MKEAMVSFRGMYKNFEYLWVSFFINVKVVSKKCTRFPSFTLLLDYGKSIARFGLFWMHWFGRCSSELAELVLLLDSRGRSTWILRESIIFVTVPWCYKDVYISSFLPHTARLWNSLHAGCFLLICGLNNFHSRVNRHLLSLGFF